MVETESRGRGGSKRNREENKGDGGVGRGDTGRIRN